MNEEERVERYAAIAHEKCPVETLDAFTRWDKLSERERNYWRDTIRAVLAEVDREREQVNEGIKIVFNEVASLRARAEAAESARDILRTGFGDALAKLADALSESGDMRVRAETAERERDELRQMLKSEIRNRDEWVMRAAENADKCAAAEQANARLVEACKAVMDARENNWETIWSAMDLVRAALATPTDGGGA